MFNNSTHMSNRYAPRRFRSKWAEVGKRHCKFQNWTPWWTSLV